MILNYFTEESKQNRRLLKELRLLIPNEDKKFYNKNLQHYIAYCNICKDQQCSVNSAEPILFIRYCQLLIEAKIGIDYADVAKRYIHYDKLVLLCREVGLLPINTAEILKNIEVFKPIYNRIASSYSELLLSIKDYSNNKDENDELMNKPKTENKDLAYYIKLLETVRLFVLWKGFMAKVQKEYIIGENHLMLIFDKLNEFRFVYTKDLNPEMKTDSSFELNLEQMYRYYAGAIYAGVCDIVRNESQYTEMLPYTKFLYTVIDNKNYFQLVGWLLFDDNCRDKDSYVNRIDLVK